MAETQNKNGKKNLKHMSCTLVPLKFWGKRILNKINFGAIRPYGDQVLGPPSTYGSRFGEKES